MEEARITITLKPIYMERLLYWIIIIALGIWLIIAYTGDRDTSSDTSSEAQQVVAPAEPVVDTTPEPVEEPEDTCSNAKKDGDETAVDCGGSCSKCAAGEACKVDTDCIGGYCVNDKCTSEAPKELSGKVTFTLNSVKTSVNNQTDAAKVTSISFKIENGLDDDLGALSLQVFVQSKKISNYCLNQQPDSGNDCEHPYATIVVNGPDSGETLSKTEEIDGRYLIPESSYYANGDSFNVIVYVYDSTGNEIGGKVISGVKTVSP